VRVVRSHSAREAKRASKSQLKLPAGGGFSLVAAKPEVALAAAIEVLVDLRDAVAKLKGQFPLACRVPNQGSGRGGCGNESGRMVSCGSWACQSSARVVGSVTLARVGSARVHRGIGTVSGGYSPVTGYRGGRDGA
jgi:hypothetical protein